MTVDEIKPRYEFRVWAGTLASVHERLGLMAQPKTAESEETYLISEATDKCNAKIRGALMDIKVLVAEDRGLEQWKPILKAGFPLESSVVATQVFASLEFPPPLLPKSAYEMDEFLDLVARTDGRLAIVGVRKTRYRFSIGSCAVEYAQVMINGVPRDTGAVESVDPDAVLQLARELSIPEPNTSYIREIKQVLGWVRQQSGS
jgi:exopolyphosphatase / guanosine-5'-triphosphate,3'-diphosphate pyrophosphatase